MLKTPFSENIDPDQKFTLQRPEWAKKISLAVPCCRAALNLNGSGKSSNAQT